MRYTKTGQYLYRNVPGWFDDTMAATLDRLFEEHDISQAIEVGAYLGRSTVFFMSRMVETISIDPFVMWPDGSKNGDAVRDGGEDFYDKFLGNIKEQRAHGPNLSSHRTLRTTSALAWENNPELKADIIFIDAQHDYESVKEDLQMWGSRAKKIICGDDYDENWPGVMQAVDEVFPNRIVEGRLWYVII